MGSPIAPSPMNPTFMAVDATAPRIGYATSGDDVRVRFRAALRHPGRAVRRRARGRARCARPGRVGVAEVAELHGLVPRTLTTCGPWRPTVSVARALALFTIGETPWSAAQRAAILGRLRGGGLSVLAIHSATDACYGWDDYGRVVGARFDGHPWTQTVDLEVVARDHPATAHLGGSWRWHDEVYQFRDLRDDAQILLRARPRTSISTPRAPTTRPSASRCRGASPRGRDASSRRASGTSPARGRVRRTSVTSPAASNGHWTSMPDRGPCADRERATSPPWASNGSSRTRRSWSRPILVPGGDDVDAPRREGANASVPDRLRALIGDAPIPVPLDVEVLGSVDCGTYRRDTIVFDVEPTMSVPAHLLVPHARTEPGPAILAVHGHGPGKDEVCGVDTPSVQAAFAEHHGDYAHTLAERGYVVLAPDLRCFGERADWQPRRQVPLRREPRPRGRRRREPARAEPLGPPACALDVLAEDPLVDAGRLGVVGFSYGATMTLFLAALDDRVRAAVVSGYLSSWKAAHRVPWNLCGSQVLPGMLGTIEHVDVAALVAPARCSSRPAKRTRFPEAAARATVGQLRRCTAIRAPAETRWCTTCSTARTAGTVRSSVSSSTVGWIAA